MSGFTSDSHYVHIAAARGEYRGAQVACSMPSIFLLRDETELVEMTEQPYASEDLLQTLLADHPSVLAGDQFNGEPKRWLLVGREAGVPCEEDGPDRWSLDHLFVDQDGIPTLVEVKRSSDSRIRREVIGQMLDYAANAVVYWPAEVIRARYEQNCETAGNDPQERLAEFLRLDPGVDPAVDPANEADRFWETVNTNLRAGRIRMVFVADLVPPELRRVVEFLNGHMDPAEVRLSTPDVITGRPAFDLLLLADPVSESRFHTAIAWAVDQIRNGLPLGQP